MSSRPSSSVRGIRTPQQKPKVVSFSLTFDPEKHKREENPTILPSAQTTWLPYVGDTFLDSSSDEVAEQIRTQEITKESLPRYLRDYYDYISSVKQCLEGVDENTLASAQYSFQNFIKNTIIDVLDKRFAESIQQSKDNAMLDQIAAKQNKSSSSSGGEFTSIPGFDSHRSPLDESNQTESYQTDGIVPAQEQT